MNIYKKMIIIAGIILACAFTVCLIVLAAAGVVSICNSMF